MVSKLDKTPEMNNPETYILTHNRLYTHLVLIFNDLNKTQIYKMLYRESPHCEIELVMSFEYLNVFKPNERKEDYHNRKPNDENFLFENEDEKNIYVGEKVITFETIDNIVENFSELGFNEFKFPYAYAEINIFLCYIENLFKFKNMKIQHWKMSMSICIKEIKNWKVKRRCCWIR